MALPKNKELFSQCPEKTFFEEDDSALLLPDTSVTPTAQLRAFLECSWAGRVCVWKNEGKDSLSGCEYSLRIWGRRAEGVCERKRRREKDEDTSRVGESLG